MDPLVLLLRASLLVLLVNSNNDPPLFVGVAVTCAIVLPRPALLGSPWLWAGLFLVVGARQLSSWHAVDDHIVVTTYWCGALAVGLTATDPRRTLAASARLLIGAVFAFAAGWKLWSGEFIDGSFFRYSLLFDDRFETVARVVGGTTDAMRHANLDGLNALAADPRAGREIVLLEGPRNVAVAQAFTWWGVLVETAVAVVFLVPLRRRWELLRPIALAAFAGTTYLIVPVGGFGVMLLVLGSAQASSDRLRVGYLWASLALLAWAGVWPLLFL
jgi:hypothetical protein